MYLLHLYACAYAFLTASFMPTTATPHHYHAGKAPSIGLNSVPHPQCFMGQSWRGRHAWLSCDTHGYSPACHSLSCSIHIYGLLAGPAKQGGTSHPYPHLLHCHPYERTPLATARAGHNSPREMGGGGRGRTEYDAKRDLGRANAPAGAKHSAQLHRRYRHHNTAPLPPWRRGHRIWRYSPEMTNAVGQEATRSIWHLQRGYRPGCCCHMGGRLQHHFAMSLGPRLLAPATLYGFYPTPAAPHQHEQRAPPAPSRAARLPHHLPLPSYARAARAAREQTRLRCDALTRRAERFCGSRAPPRIKLPTL